MAFLDDLVSNFNNEKKRRNKIPGLIHLTTIIPGRLYFGAIISKYIEHVQNASNPPYRPLFNTEFFYKRFEEDFGPYNLAVVYLFCKKLHDLMQFTEENPDKPILHLAQAHEEDRVNSAFLMGCYAIIHLGMDVPTIMTKLRKNNPYRYRPYRDASQGYCDYPLELQDCLKAIHKALKLGILNFSTFDLAEYLYYEEVENGDLNWIIPGKLLAFCGPSGTDNCPLSTYSKLTPQYYFQYFSDSNVTTIVRLNKKVYDAKLFTDAGFDHKDLFFTDGTTPSRDIVEKFLQICEKTPGAVAVHCKAGLGRTGTLIGCYLMKHYRFTAAEAIAWIRICRPGSVIGAQQQWLVDAQPYLWAQGKALKNEKLNDAGDEKSDVKKIIIDDINRNQKISLASEGKGVKPENGFSKITCEFKRIELKDASNQLKKMVEKIGNNNDTNNNNNNDNKTDQQTAAIKNKKCDHSTETQGDRLIRIKASRGSRASSQPNERIIPIRIEGRPETGKSSTPCSYSIVSSTTTSHHPYNTRSCCRSEAVKSASNAAEYPVVGKSTRSSKGDLWRQVVPVHEVIFDPPSSANPVNLINKRIIKPTANLFRSRGRSYSPMRFSRISPSCSADPNIRPNASSTSSKLIPSNDPVRKTGQSSATTFAKSNSYSSSSASSVKPITFSSSASAGSNKNTESKR